MQDGGDSNLKLIGASGQMADLVRDYPWGSTPVGPMETWPETLLSNINLMLSSPLPATLIWGEELVFFYNDEAIPTLGAKHPAALGRSYREVFEEAWHLVGPDIENCLRNGVAPVRENVSIPILKDGQMQNQYWTYSLIPVYERGRIAGVYDPYMNTTDAVLAARERDALADQLQQVLEATTDAVVSLNRDWVFTFVNSKARELLLPSGEILGKNLWETFPHAAYEGSPYVEHYRRAMKEGIEGGFEAYYPEPLNKWLHIMVHPARDGMIAFFRDITARKQEEEYRRENEAKLRLATEAAQLGIFTWYPRDRRVTWENDRIYKIFDRDREDGPMSANEFREGVLFPEYLKGFGEAIRRTRESGSRFAYPCQFRREDGSSGWLEITGQFEGADGAPERILGTVQDITLRKQSEEALRISEKVAAVGRLASSIAHEINNPLESVTNLLYLARNNNDVASIQQYLELAERELRRVSAITNQTLRFHRQSSKPRAVDNAELIEDVLSIHQGRIVNANVEVQFRKRATRPVVCFDGEIRQVLNNLVGNAIDAMHPGGGRLLLRSREVADRGRGAGVVITVADTGSGIQPTSLKKIFDPFFTTKGLGGTGLGLWVSQEIVARHRGSLRVRSRQWDGRSGTVFTLFLPFVPANA